MQDGRRGSNITGFTLMTFLRLPAGAAPRDGTEHSHRGGFCQRPRILMLEWTELRNGRVGAALLEPYKAASHSFVSLVNNFGLKALACSKRWSQNLHRIKDFNNWTEVREEQNLCSSWYFLGKNLLWGKQADHSERCGKNTDFRRKFPCPWLPDLVACW